MGSDADTDRNKKGMDKSGTNQSSNQSSNQNKSALQRGGFNSVARKKFDGKCTDLKGYIYDCSDSQKIDSYAKTTKQI